MKKIFISYSRVDEIFARLIATDLARLGADFWMDVQDIIPSVAWNQAIEDGLAQSDVMLLVASPQAMASDYVRQEWETFRDAGKPILPLLRGCDVNCLPEELAQLQVIDFNNSDYVSARDAIARGLAHHGIVLDTETEWKALRNRQHLLHHRELPTLEQLASTADHIDIISISSISLTVTYDSFVEDSLRRDKTRWRIILLDPDNDNAHEIWSQLSDRPSVQTRMHIEQTLDMFSNIFARVPGAQARCKIKFGQFPFPYNLFAADSHKESGVMQIGYYAYNKAGASSRPHLILRQADDPDWFAFYRQQFEAAWDIARLWTPQVPYSDE